MSDIEYSVITSDIIYTIDCIKMDFGSHLLFVFLERLQMQNYMHIWILIIP